MVSPLFDRLPDAKRDRIDAALRQEFSTYPVAEAQVARIVKAAGIARGAFYQYFTDLEDAYDYLFGQAMQTIHADMPRQVASPKALLAKTAAFLEDAAQSPYQALIRQHFAANEAHLTPHATPMGDPLVWAAMVLSHTTIHDVLLDPDSKPARLAQLEAALNALKEG